MYLLIVIYHSSIIKSNWDESKPVADNLSKMGLVVDPNKIMGLPKPYEGLGLPAPMDIDSEGNLIKKSKKRKSKKKKEVVDTSVVQSLKEEAEKEVPKNYNLSPEMAKFAVYMIEKHGEDYEAMQRDKKNIYQLSGGVIKKTIKQFLKIPSNVYSYEKAKEIARKAIEEEMSD